MNTIAFCCINNVEFQFVLSGKALAACHYYAIIPTECTILVPAASALPLSLIALQTDSSTKMSVQRELYLIARNLDNVEDDIRHRLLDVSQKLFDLAENMEQFPSTLQSEFREIIVALKDVQPVFPSQRNTSVLFDRAGLGSIGRKTATDLAQRILSLANEMPDEESS